MKPNMELRHLRYFVAVAEALNVSHAARRLRTAQPSLSRQIRQLEEFVRRPLFLRQKNRLDLTEAGRQLLTEARRILQDVECTIDAIREVPSDAGRISVGLFPGSDWKVFSRLVSFASFESNALQLVMHSMSSAEQLVGLHDRTIQVGFLRGPIADAQIASEVIRSDSIVVALPAKNPVARLKRIPLHKLADMPLIELKKAGARRYFDLAISLAAEQGVVLRPGLKTNNVLETLMAVSAGLGFSLLPNYVEQLAPKAVVTRPLEVGTPPAIDLLLAYRRDDKTPQLAAFLELARECFARESKSDGIPRKHSSRLRHIQEFH